MLSPESLERKPMPDDMQIVTLRERGIAAAAYLTGVALLALVPLLALVLRLSVLSPLFLVHVVAAPSAMVVYSAITRGSSHFIRLHAKLAVSLHLIMLVANGLAVHGVRTTECADIGSLYGLALYGIAVPANAFVGAVCVLVVLLWPSGTRG